MPARRRRWPVTRRVTAGVTATRAAGPGTIRTRIRSTNGLAPETEPTTLTTSEPVEPERTMPSESTRPSK